MNTNDDQALTAMLAWRDHRDDNAALWLVEQFTPLLYSIALRTLPRPCMVDDAVQTAWMKFFRHLDRFDPRIPLSAWAVCVVKSVCSNVIRSWRRRQVFIASDLGADDLGHFQANLSSAPAADTLIAREDLRRIVRRIGKLANTDQLIVSQLFMGDATTHDVAALTGLSTGAIRVRACRIRHALRKELETANH